MVPSQPAADRSQLCRVEGLKLWIRNHESSPLRSPHHITLENPDGSWWFLDPISAPRNR